MYSELSDGFKLTLRPEQYQLTGTLGWLIDVCLKHRDLTQSMHLETLDWDGSIFDYNSISTFNPSPFSQSSFFETRCSPGRIKNEILRLTGKSLDDIQEDHEKVSDTTEARPNDDAAAKDLLYKGIDLEGKGYYDDAISLYQKIIQEFPDTEFAETAQIRIGYSISSQSRKLKKT